MAFVKFVTNRNFSTTNLSSFNFCFFSSRNISVNPHDYQLVTNENFSEWVSKGPHKMSGNPRICLVNTQFWPDTVLWSAVICSPVCTINIKNKESWERKKRNIIEVFFILFYYEVVKKWINISEIGFYLPCLGRG